MPKHEHISFSVIRRLPRYYRFLGDLVRNGVTRISSHELSERMGLTASQIRQDLNCFGGFGQQGYGYNTSLLQNEIGSILGVDDAVPLIVVGVGNLGRAITMNMDFDHMGFRLVGLFDKKPALIGTHIRGAEVHDIARLEDFCRRHHPLAAVITVPRDAAPEIAERLANLGIIGFWNFSHYDLSVKYPHINVENVHLGDSLMTLSYVVKGRLEESREPAPQEQGAPS